MVIFHSYVSLPEGRMAMWRYLSHFQTNPYIETMVMNPCAMTFAVLLLRYKLHFCRPDEAACIKTWIVNRSQGSLSGARFPIAKWGLLPPRSWTGLLLFYSFIFFRYRNIIPILDFSLFALLLLLNTSWLVLSLLLCLVAPGKKPVLYILQ